jgi:hypothetical protein
VDASSETPDAGAMTRARRVTVVACATIGLHALGLLLAALTLRPGTDLVPANARIAYLAQAPLGWSLGWGVWMLCALSLVALLFVVSRAAGDTPLTRLALTLGVAGLAVDLVCDVVHIRMAPALAAVGDARLLIALEALATSVGAVVANGLYSLAALLVSGCLWKRGATRVAQLGVAVFVAGMAMVAAGFDAVPSHMQLGAGLAISLYCAWAFAVARFLSPR